MIRSDRHQNNQPVIRQLDASSINRIAAGEVVERPASAVKELVENSIDSGAKRISVDFSNGGKSLIRVMDDGCGIVPEDMMLAVARHATSKVDGTDLLNIYTFGFRGEALASLAAVGRLTLKSRVGGLDATVLQVTGGRSEPLKPTALSGGTVIELRDLFFATPARLKFLRTDRAESQAILDVVKRLAIAEPSIAFHLSDSSWGSIKRTIFKVSRESGDLSTAIKGRLARVIGDDFIENAVPISAENHGYRLLGYAGLPTYSRGTGVAQYLFVNGRPVRDRMLTGVLRAAYMDFLKQGRHPVVALFVDCDPELVDVNVHPAKLEVRFRDPGAVRSLLVSGIRSALEEAGHRTSTTIADAILNAVRTKPGGYNTLSVYPGNKGDMDIEAAGNFLPEMSNCLSADIVDDSSDAFDLSQYRLGVARAQVHENYIIAQTDTGVVIVDQHAAHERIVYEKLKKQMAENAVAAQALLIPEIVELRPEDCSALLSVADDLKKFGLTIEAFGQGAVAVRETPAILGEVDAKQLLKDIVDELLESGDTLTVQARIESLLGRVACYGSIRSGRRLRGEEMNALLREMEATPRSGQCNHGRPTYVELKLSDIERLFGRT
ncbi:MAG: DNA mismatch repair endonuclease MutL [Aestuariivita sp.]|nr:DNA mismatch repair endonuclease MutL [Aestuariivita sp.]